MDIVGSRRGRGAADRTWVRSAALVPVLVFLAPGLLFPDLAEIRKRGKIRVLLVSTGRASEFFSLEPGTSPGFDRELLESFAKTQRLRIEPVVTPTMDGLIPALQAGKGDLIAGRFTDTELRRRLVDFSVEVFPTRNVVLTRKPHKPVKTVDELKTLRVGTIRGSNLAEAVMAVGVPPRNVDDSIPAGGLPDALKTGKVDAVVTLIDRAILVQRQDPDFEIGPFIGGPLSLAYAVRRGDSRLLEALNAHIHAAIQGNEWSRLVLKYFGDAAPEILRKARGK